jgi:23S rRNA (uracil1939-C5)-methyltransferase
MDVTIEKLIYGGEGLAHHNGATVFVPFVLPSERAAIAPAEQKKKFIRARLERVLDASPERIAPRCPYFGVCGGCDYQHIPYESQLKYKTEILRETLRRIGKIEWAGEIIIHTSKPWGYRNRAQWKVRPRRASAEQRDDAGSAALGIGYFRANSTALCPVSDCPILSPLLLKTLLALRDALAGDALPKQLREIEAFADAADAKLLLTATFAGFPSHAAELAAKIRSVVPEIESLLFHDPGRERMELFGPGFIEYEVGGHWFRVSHFSFFQVNNSLVDEMANEVACHNEVSGRDEADGSEQVTGCGDSGRLALDLFAGVGLFAAPLAKKFDRVIAVEENPAATRDLETRSFGSGGIEVRTQAVERFLERFKETPDLVVVDPPRDGMPRPALDRLVKLRPPRITYVSCEPPTLARDLAVLLAGGYEISEMHLFDLFPQTFHMEAVTRLRRRE